MMVDAIGEHLEPGDYVVVCLGDRVNRLHLGRVINGDSETISVSLRTNDRTEGKWSVPIDCLAKVNKETAILYTLSK